MRIRYAAACLAVLSASVAIGQGQTFDVRVLPVQGFDTTTQNAGAPDGTSAQPGGGFARGFATMQVSLYDCADRTQ
jgi:hypothetical protein